MSLLILPLFVLIVVHWNLNCWVCKLLESGSAFRVALTWGAIPKTNPPMGQGPHASPLLCPSILAHCPEVSLGCAAAREVWVMHAQPLLFVLSLPSLTMVIYMATR